MTPIEAWNKIIPYLKDTTKETEAAIDDILINVRDEGYEDGYESAEKDFRGE